MTPAEGESPASELLTYRWMDTMGVLTVLATFKAPGVHVINNVDRIIG